MKKNTIIFLCMLAILSVVIFLIIRESQQSDTLISNDSNQSVIEFTATLTESPEQVDQTDNYYLSFDNVQADSEDSQRDLVTFDKGGKLIATLPADKEIKSGDQIRVRVHKDFATTHSIPPQLIGNSVISVSF
ncbi:hypothetical protein IGK25_002714 [Enterococcus sp. DIV1614a]|uniref:DUF4131 domain-containing protein n=1 Tax=Enterococcus sp. DIV1614a TaxID=2774817 RepID=UPI0015712B18|nr:DUF4131 domain-containing protein [Enterococcus faecalis]